jgi:tellurite resistance protein TerC
VTYVFGGFLILTAARMLVVRHDTIDPDRHPLTRLVRRFLPVVEPEGSRFFVRTGGRLAVTPLFLALVLVEGSDIVFALDSIPAIFAITRDPFLVWTSNIFAILGLRSLYFALAGLMDRFRYLKMSLVFLLAYVGVKMILTHHHPIPNFVSLAIIGGVLAVGILASFAATADTAKLVSPLADELEDLAAVTYRQGRRIVILLLGSSVLLVGAAMVVLPGPAILVIPLGLAILGLEFAWARLWLRKIRNAAATARRRLQEAMGDEPDAPAG